MAMSEKVRAEYDAALRKVIAKHGTLVSERASYYAWADHRGDWHRYADGGCPVTITGRVYEDYWDEFKGTFYEGDTTVHGVTATGVNCACGQIKDRQMRWSASVSEVAEAVFEAAFGDDSADEGRPQ